MDVYSLIIKYIYIYIGILNLSKILRDIYWLLYKCILHISYPKTEVNDDKNDVLKVKWK